MSLPDFRMSQTALYICAFYSCNRMVSSEGSHLRSVACVETGEAGHHMALACACRRACCVTGQPLPDPLAR